ncbi:MAG: outer membrane beta-barrel domain-containing protein [Pseudomonadales bacterium]|nr:outer membrane beta-barrel domain-containing protein [Pseudomonadales bacterium]
MENWLQRIFLMAVRNQISAILAAMLISFSMFSYGENLEWSVASDQTTAVFEPEVERAEINKPDIDTEDFEFGVSYGLMSVEDFGVSSVLAARLAYHISEYIFAEAVYGQTDTQETSFEVLNGTSLLTEDQRQYQYYNLSVGYNLLPGEVFFLEDKTFVSELYVVMGAGSTEFAGDQYFTVNVGMGYRLLLTDEIALHVDVRDHMLDIDFLGIDKTSHNLEVTGGLTVFF